MCIQTYQAVHAGRHGPLLRPHRCKALREAAVHERPRHRWVVRLVQAACTGVCARGGAGANVCESGTPLFTALLAVFCAGCQQ